MLCSKSPSCMVFLSASGFWVEFGVCCLLPAPRAWWLRGCSEQQQDCAGGWVVLFRKEPGLTRFGCSDHPHFRTLDIPVGWWVSGKFATCLAGWCKMGVLPLAWCCCPRSLMASCHLHESRKESCQFSIKTSSTAPSW